MPMPLPSLLLSAISAPLSERSALVSASPTNPTSFIPRTSTVPLMDSKSRTTPCSILAPCAFSAATRSMRCASARITSCTTHTFRIATSMAAGEADTFPAPRSCATTSSACSAAREDSSTAGEELTLFTSARARIALKRSMNVSSLACALLRSRSSCSSFAFCTSTSSWDALSFSVAMAMALAAVPGPACMYDSMDTSTRLLASTRAASAVPMDSAMTCTVLMAAMLLRPNGVPSVCAWFSLEPHHTASFQSASSCTRRWSDLPQKLATCSQSVEKRSWSWSSLCVSLAMSTWILLIFWMIITAVSSATFTRFTASSSAGSTSTFTAVAPLAMRRSMSATAFCASITSPCTITPTGGPAASTMVTTAASLR
mmetsp:Transcript_72/g.112  ORF Transcript_72/g.112 Transcript_72/m.112 type:complete len:371 (-) Transcript_72:5487-6599(-)